MAFDVLLTSAKTHSAEANMSRPTPPSTDLPLLPALNIGLLALGAAIHHSPALLSPVVGWAHSLSVALIR